MFYIYLQEPVKDFTKIRICSVSYNNAQDGESISVLYFKYQLYKKSDNKVIVFYDRNITITDNTFLESLNVKTDLPVYDFVCKKLLQYLVNQKIETGTIEKE
jgi:hypothetical protein